MELVPVNFRAKSRDKLTCFTTKRLLFKPKPVYIHVGTLEKDEGGGTLFFLTAETERAFAAALRRKWASLVGNADVDINWPDARRKLAALQTPPRPPHPPPRKPDPPPDPAAADDEEEPATFRAELTASLPLLYARARYLCRDRELANDLIQETMERALLAASRFRRGTSVPAWLMIIMRNLFLDRARREHLYRSVERGSFEEIAAAEPEAHVETESSAFDLEDVRRAMESLSSVDRDILQQTTLQGIGLDAISAHLKISRSTAATRLFRARGRLRRQLRAMRDTLPPTPRPSIAAVRSWRRGRANLHGRVSWAKVKVRDRFSVRPTQ